ncbi:MAG: 3'-5' exoribonuclease YhaM family protein [Acutalibacteraceae bacterium]
MNFTQINKTGTVEGFCLIKTVERKLTSRGVPFLDMTLTDSDGEVGAKLWDYKEELHGEFVPNDLVKVRGTMTPFNDTQQLRIERIRRVSDEDGVRIEDFVPSAGFSGEAMFDELIAVADAFSDEELKLLVKTLLNEYRDRLVYWPAAFRLHHAIRGGLLYHTLSILRMAQSVAKIYPFIDSDLLFAGVILHDIAKTQEFDVAPTGIASGYTVDGNLVGHLVRGAMAVEKCGRELGLSEETLMLVEHMIISHHGEPEFGAAVRPMFLEAEILSELDTLDAKIYEIEQACRGVEPGEFTQRQWALDNRKLYNHNRNSKDFKAELI